VQYTSTVTMRMSSNTTANVFEIDLYIIKQVTRGSRKHWPGSLWEIALSQSMTWHCQQAVQHVFHVLCELSVTMVTSQQLFHATWQWQPASCMTHDNDPTSSTECVRHLLSKYVFHTKLLSGVFRGGPLGDAPPPLAWTQKFFEHIEPKNFF